jgi:hypothetical protein
MKTLNPKLKDFMIYTKPTRENRSFFSVGTRLAAWLLVGLTISLGFVFALLMKTPLLLALALPPIVLLFKRLRRLAKRHRINGEQKLLNDHRDPILYLRTFEKGRVENPKRQDMKTHEERLTSVLEYVGPVVAVGEPGEDRPPIGALRLYFNYSEWEGKVKERPVRESNPCRRREREAIYRNSKETCGMDSTVR